MLDIEKVTAGGVRALFCIGITQEFFNEQSERLPSIGRAIAGAFADLSGRFGVTVLGTFDDDLLQVGRAEGFPYISYILAEVPDVPTAMKVANLIRTPFEGGRLAKYLTIQTRIGHKLFFGND